MRNLTDEQVDLIAEDIRVRGVFSQSLQEDLLDHICCFIEEQDDERPFEEIYLLAMDAFGQSGLQGVQDETLYLINRPYLTKMKKIAYFSGGISATALVLGALFKVQHWPGANIMLIAGTLLMTFFFIPYFFYTQFTEQTEKKGRIISALGLTTAVLMATGAFFKLMHWPGAAILIIAFAFFFLIFLPLYIINGARNPLTRMQSVSNGFLFACIGGFMMLLSFQNPSKAVTDALTTIEQNEQQVLLSLQAKMNNSALTAFVTTCNAAVAAEPNNSGSNTIGNGDPLSPQSLLNINEAIRAAVLKLNEDMSGTPGWKPLAFTEIQPSLYGSAKFQVLQLETRAYVNAIP